MRDEKQLYRLWLDHLTEDEARELKKIDGDDGAIEDAFYRDLSFGTAGLRGVLGMGTNRMNTYTVRRATQALAAWLLETCEKPRAAIAYDSRINSDLFAKEAACVLAANGVTVHLYSELMPTPALSYAVRELGCDAGIVITASHNPAKYNGYKAYGSDGCQIGPEEAARIMALMEQTDMFSGARTTGFEQAVAGGSIRMIPESFVQEYLDRVMQESVNPGVCGKAGLKLVYTPLNGAGRRCVLGVLGMAGVRDITVVKEQEQPDGNFPTCPYPNPEIEEALALGLKLCKEVEADLLLATDPDCDRVAVAVLDGGQYHILTGNEVGVLLLDYIARARKEGGTLPSNPVAVKSIVSSKLADLVAAEHGVEMVNVLTGFKFIGEVILNLEKDGQEGRYILGFEESCGYLSGPYVRDKDAVDASLLLVEMASAYKLSGKTLLGALRDIYSRHGVFKNAVSSFAFEGADGMKKMAGIMAGLRQDPPKSIAGTVVAACTDYGKGLQGSGTGSIKIDLPPSDVLEYVLADGCSVIVRPSGTEPKIKLYYSLTAGTPKEVEALAARYAEACEKLIGVG